MREPDVTFKIREGRDWVERETVDFFGGKRCVIFGLPGAFTPTCTNEQLPAFEVAYPKIRNLGITHVYCISVNDSFVMNAWAKTQQVSKVKVLPDGSGEFTRQMGMLVDKDNLGFGQRSWRYAVYVDNMKIVNHGLSQGCEIMRRTIPMVRPTPTISLHN